MIGLVVSLGLIAYFAWKLEWSLVGQELSHLNYLALVPVTLVFTAHLFLRAWRWRYFLPNGRDVRFRSLFDSFMVGGLATFILPLRAGEFVRPYILSRKSPVSFSVGFVSVVIERFFDLAAVLISFGVLALYLPHMRQEAYQGAFMLSVVAAAILVVIGLGAFTPGVIRSLSAIAVCLLPRRFRQAPLRFTEQFLAGTTVLRSPSNLFMASFFTVLVWGSNYALYYIYPYLINLEPSILLAVTVAVFLALVVAAPSMPGFVGVYQLGCVWAFELLGFTAEKGIAFAIVTHLFQYLVLVGYGSFVMLRDNLRFADLTQARGSQEERA